MRSITILPPVTLKKDNGSTEQFTFEQFLLSVLNDPLACTNFELLSKAIAIRQGITAAMAAGATDLRLEEADWAHLAGIVKAPSGGWNPRVAYDCFGYIKAILDAAQVPLQGA